MYVFLIPMSCHLSLSLPSAACAPMQYSSFQPCRILHATGNLSGSFVFHHLRFLAVALSFITDSTLTDDNYCAIASAVVNLLQDILRSCGKDGCLPETTSCLDQHVDHFAVCHVILWFYALFSSHWFVGTHWCNWIKTTSIDGGGPWSCLGEWEWGWGWWVATSGRLNVVCNAFYSFTSYWCFGDVSKLLQIDYNTQNDNGFGQTT